MSSKQSASVRRQIEDGWEWFIADGEQGDDITGKYLFFSPDRGQLVRVAIDELERGGFSLAKLPAEGHQVGDDYVLCLYYLDDSRKDELATKYHGQENLRYRYWKTEESTEAGEYSSLFLSGLADDADEDTLDLQIRVLTFQIGDEWLVQCIDHAVAARNESFECAVGEIAEQFVLHCHDHGGPPDADPDAEHFERIANRFPELSQTLSVSVDVE